MLRNTIVGKIARGLVKVMQSMVKPEQPNQICCSQDDLEDYLQNVVLPGKVASSEKFKAPANRPSGVLNTTEDPVRGYEPRGTLSQHKPKFARIPTKYLVDTQETWSLDKSPSARTT